MASAWDFLLAFGGLASASMTVAALKNATLMNSAGALIFSAKFKVLEPFGMHNDRKRRSTQEARGILREKRHWLALKPSVWRLQTVLSGFAFACLLQSPRVAAGETRQF